MAPPPPALRRCAEQADDWLFTRAIPLWLEHGVDRARGGFHEALDPATLRGTADFRRLRVTARQIYVFTQAALRGIPRADEAVAHGLSFLARLAHPAGGFASRADRDGNILDPSRDLYDLAFTLFAFAHAFRLGGDARLKDQALALLAFIRTEMHHPAGGYVEALPPRAPRRQNPHMHLLEAALAGAEHMPHPAFDRLCDELATLCERHFLDPHAGLLHEYYSDEWVPRRHAGRAVVEPGHHLEWAWLLAELARVRGRIVAGGPALAAFALRHGRDPATGLLRGELHDDGTVASATVRLWPHGEWLKAALILPGAAGDAPGAWRALAAFLTPAGLWRETWDHRAGAFIDAPAPASTLYHITSAVVELRRFAGLRP